MPKSDSIGREHLLAFVETFVLARRKDRFRAKPDELLDALCHRSDEVLDLRRAIRVPTSTRTETVIHALSSARVSTAVYLGAWADLACREHDLPCAVRMVESTGGAAASILPGRLAYTLGEVPDNRGDRYIFAADGRLRLTITGLLTV